jgi:hypothetical protein
MFNFDHPAESEKVAETIHAAFLLRLKCTIISKLAAAIPCIALQLVEGVLQRREDGREIFRDGFAAARQADKNAPSQRAGHSARNGCCGRFLEAGRHHGLLKARQAAFHDGQGRLGGTIPRGEAGAAG